MQGIMNRTGNVAPVAVKNVKLVLSVNFDTSTFVSTTLPNLPKITAISIHKNHFLKCEFVLSFLFFFPFCTSRLIIRPSNTANVTFDIL